METIRIDLKKQILWYALFNELSNKYPNASISEVINYTNDLIKTNK